MEITIIVTGNNELCLDVDANKIITFKAAKQ